MAFFQSVTIFYFFLPSQLFSNSAITYPTKVDFPQPGSPLINKFLLPLFLAAKLMN
jgi:hypothetical protein